MEIPVFVTGPEGILELVLDVEQPDTNRTRKKRNRQLHSRNGPMPTSQIVVAARTAIARFVAIVLSQDANHCASVRLAVGAAR